MRADRRILRGPALIRAGRDADAPGFIALIEACWAEYPGCVLDIDREAPELRALATHYAGKGGSLWVAGEVDGMIAAAPIGDGDWEIGRVYVHPRLHGTGLGHRLAEVAEAHAAESGAKRLVLWTDTRFRRAHRFYENRGWVRDGPVRALADLSHTLEHQYGKPVAGRVAR